MIEDILKLEKASEGLEPSSEAKKAMLDQAWTYADKFLVELESAPVFKADNGNSSLLNKYDISEEGRSMETAVEVFAKGVEPPGLNAASAGHLGYIPGGGVYASAVADFMAAVTNKYAGLYFSSPGVVKLENQLIRWSADLLGYPSTTRGNITSGGSIANLIALATARDAKNITPDRIAQSVIYFSQQTHHCVYKAVRIAGLVKCQMRRIPVDQRYRMDPRALKEQMEQDVADGYTPFYVASSCGSTDTGAVDEFEKIADICEAFNAWFHIDGAYGGYFALVDQLKPLFKGIDRSDSVVLDPHKSLFLPYGTGIVLIKDGKALFDTFHYMANYLQDVVLNDDEPSPADLSPELTKHFRGLRMWLPLQLHGVSAFRASLEEKYLLTQYFYEEVQKIGFEVGPTPQLSVSIYRFIPSVGDANAYNEKLVKDINADGRLFVSSTTIEGVFWIRIAILSFRTHIHHIDTYLSILKDLTQGD